MIYNNIELNKIMHFIFKSKNVVFKEQAKGQPYSQS